MSKKRIYPIGAEYSKAGTHFRVWAPHHKQVSLILEEEGQKKPMKREAKGYFSVYIPHVKSGALYWYQLGKERYADPASRYQPFGVMGPSAVVDPQFKWKEESWKGVDWQHTSQIIYELHIGTFTQEGTFAAAMQELPSLVQLGITIIELMPIAEFAGRWGWGYDGVLLFAPFHHYGKPEDLKTFINRAHQLGIGVILDVVYNHLGPEGNYFARFSKHYFHREKTTDWGEALNFDHPLVKEYFVANAQYWMQEFRFDGLRLDATSSIHSTTKPHVLKELSHAVHQARPKRKKKIIVAENELQDITLVRDYGFDALWNDDFHHTLNVRLTGKREGYYLDYLGMAQECLSALHLDLPLSPTSFIAYLENHDQVANPANGKRLHQLCDFGNYKAMTCLLLLGPHVPMLFQGQEFGSQAPFYFFVDHSQDLNKKIRRGREKFLAQFPSIEKKNIQDPAHPQTFYSCKLKKTRNKHHYTLYRDLIHLRSHDPVFKQVNHVEIQTAILNDDAFLLRYRDKKEKDRLLIFNLGREPLISPEQNQKWKLLWSSEDARYGGQGVLAWNPLRLPAHAALVLEAP